MKLLYERAREHVSEASAAVERLRTADGLIIIRAAWSDFLVHYHRVFTRLHQATKGGPDKGWFDRVKHERSTDELLSYLMHARNADEHGLERVTGNTYASFVMGMPPPGQTIRNVSVVMNKNGEMEVDWGDSPRPKFWQTTAAKATLVPVTDRGITYRPPTSHLGQPLTDTSLLHVAERGLAYIEALVAAAEARHDGRS